MPPDLMWLWLSKPMGSHFGVGEFATHFRTYFSGDWDVHWGYGLLTHGHVFFPLFFPVCEVAPGWLVCFGAHPLSSICLSLTIIIFLCWFYRESITPVYFFVQPALKQMEVFGGV